MSPLIILGSIVGLPLLLFILLRVKPLYLFTSIVTGYFLMTLLGDTAELTFSSMVHTANSDTIVKLGLLLIPLLITLFLMRKTLSAVALPFQLILLIANALLLAEFVVSLLPPGTQHAIYVTKFGSIFKQASDLVIAGVAVLHVIVMWIMRSRYHDEHGHHGKKHHK
jgi:hypothetical protein